MNKKRILLISYHFPPSPAVGGLRIAGFARHLPFYGWEPCVLTIPENYVQNPDHDRLHGLKGLKILRAPTLPGMLQTYLKLKALYVSLMRGKKVSVSDLEYEYSMAGSNTINKSNNTQKRLKNFLFSLLTLPDGERNWLIPGFLTALREIRRTGIKAILTSSPPHSVQLIGLLLKKLCNIYWIADFRDPWINPTKKIDCRKNNFLVTIENIIENNVITNADKVLTTNEMFTEALRDSYSQYDSKKFITLPNGYDSEPSGNPWKAEKYEPFTITHTGTLYIGRTPEPVFSAVKSLISEQKIGKKDLRIKLVGFSDIVNGKPVKDISSKHGLDDVVELSGQVSYPKSLEIIRRSHLALLLAPNQPYQVPAKTFDYIGCGTPILALADHGATSRLIESTGTGKVYHPSDIEGIKTFIYESYKKREFTAGITNNSRTQFERKNLVGTLAKVLDKAI